MEPKASHSEPPSTCEHRPQKTRPEHSGDVQQLQPVDLPRPTEEQQGKDDQQQRQQLQSEKDRDMRIPMPATKADQQSANEQ